MHTIVETGPTAQSKPAPRSNRLSGRSRRVALRLLLILSVGLWLWNSGSASNAHVTHDAISRPRGAATSADVEIAMSVGEVRIGALDESTNLIGGDIAYPDQNSVERRFTVRGDTASFTLREQDSRASNLVRFRNSGASWNLRLSPDVSLRLKLETGVGEANIDLAQLKVFDLTLDNGIGNTTLTLPRHGKVRARVTRGIGETTIRVPSGVAVRLKVDGGLGNIKVPESYWHQGNIYVSPDYDTATNRVDMTASSEISDITIQHIGE